MTQYEFAIDILTRLNDAGHDAYLVGGFVRDRCLHRTAKDVDIATAATPDQISTLFPNSERVGAKFGVQLVKGGGFSIEVATFRTDGGYTDGRHPDSVAFTTDWREDVKRRDFTVNALLLDAKGATLDNVGGLSDLHFKVIRAIGNPDDRFQEDALRMMRAVRFAVVLGFEIEERTLGAIQRNAHLIARISAERVRDELDKILLSGDADRGMDLLSDTGLLDPILPEVAALKGVPQNPKHHPEGDVWIHTMYLLAGLRTDATLTLALAALLHDVGKPGTLGLKDGQPTFYEHEELGATMTRTILNRLRYPNEVTSKVVTLVAEHMRFRVVDEMRRSKLLRFVGQDNFSELLELHRLDSMAGRGNLRHYEYVTKVLAEVPPEVLRPVPLITGRDLIEMGFKPGPAFKEVLHKVETGQLEGGLRTREEALAWAAAWLEIGMVAQTKVEG